MAARVMRLASGGVDHAVEVTQSVEGRRRVSVDGIPFDVDVSALGPGSFVWRQGDRVETFYCARVGRVIHLCWRGMTYRLTEVDEGAPAGQRSGVGGLEAPMPGKVIAIKVSVGQQVSKGDEVLVVEAMKMENGLRAPRDGVVKAIHARVGDAVNPGVVLMELE